MINNFFIASTWGLLVGSIISNLIIASQPLVVDCSNAPPQYREAQHWLDAGHKVRCAVGSEKGETNNLWYSDAIIGK